jgi:glutaredoxin 3
MKIAVIWTQPDCIYCKKAKALLLQLGYTYIEKKITEGYTKKDLLTEVPTANTVPQIFLDGYYVGGYSDLVYKFKTI